MHLFEEYQAVMVKPKIVHKNHVSSNSVFLFIYYFLFIAKSHILLKIYLLVAEIFLLKYLKSDSICYSLHY